MNGLQNNFNRFAQIKSEYKEQSLKERTGKGLASEVALIGGDAFTSGYFAYQTVEIVLPSINKINAVAWSNIFCGEIAGAINLGVAAVLFVNTIKAYRADDNWQRQALDCICLTLVGTLMILTSLALKVGALGAMGGFFAANPWLMPVLFFVASLPIASEVILRVAKNYQNRDIGAQILRLNRNTEFEVTYTEKNGNAPVTKSITYTLNQIEDMNENDRLVALNRIANYLQTSIGVDAAIEALKYLGTIMNAAPGEARFNQETKLEQSLEKWNFAQKIRLLQQIFYALAFILSMVVFKTPRQIGTALKVAENGFLFTGNFIPLYMDSFWPLKRNTQIVVDPVLTDEELSQNNLGQLIQQKIPQKTIA